MSKKSIVILYVADQNRSRNFYRTVLNSEPVLDVPGMTEFSLVENFNLGLMPETGISKILEDKIPSPASGNGIPRCELYLITDDPETTLQKAVKGGAREISPVSERDWGDRVGYCSDPDGHVLAFAK